jgi:hypothetical protein
MPKWKRRDLRRFRFLSALMKDLSLAELDFKVGTEVCVVGVGGCQDRSGHWSRAVGICFHPVPSG